MKKTVGIIILFNPELDRLQVQLESLSKQVDCIVAVNNGLTGEQLEKLLTTHECIYINNFQNLGVAAAQNIGIRWALENGYDHILLLDDDSLPQENMVNNLFLAEEELLGKGIKVAAVGPSFFDPRKTNLIDKPGLEKKYIKEDMLISSGMLISSEVVNDVGLMNDWLFIDGIDDDWCFRALYKGYQIFRVPNALMSHRLGEVKKVFFDKFSFHYHQPFRYYYRFRNYIFLLKQPYVTWRLKLRCLRAMLKLLIKIIFLPNKVDYLKQTFKGIIAGIRSGKQLKNE
jgi:rhamnosyltransferase